MRVYIAGHIGKGLSGDVASGFNSLRDRLHRAGFEVLSPIRGRVAEDTVAYDPCEIVHRDEWDIDRADLLIARLESDKPLIGTSMEIYRAREICGIPVIIVTDSEYIANHYWIRAKATKVVKTIDEAISFASRWYL